MARRSAAASRVPVVRVELSGMRFWGRHGGLAAERRRGGPFRVRVDALVKAPRRFRDRLSETADYRRFYSCARSFVERRSFRTIEALAAAIAEAVVRVPKVQAARVRVEKLSPPFKPGTVAAAEVWRP